MRSPFAPRPQLCALGPVRVVMLAPRLRRIEALNAARIKTGKRLRGFYYDARTGRAVFCC